ncbi:hypothetical protein SOVF_205920, partial [Spinacia oleracea]
QSIQDRSAVCCPLCSLAVVKPRLQLCSLILCATAALCF